MRDEDWVGRLVEFRDSKTLGQHYSESLLYEGSARIYQGRIRSVHRGEDGRLYATAELLYVSSMGIMHFNTNPDPNWTAEQYSRRKHHRAQFRVKPGSKLLWRSCRGEMLIRYKGPKWKPVKL